ncbi:hypothetical protein [Rathayibacter tanaceti]|uniref:Uncharacterized protein n=1 Tax=Rathayibacter tanaceti TaxID=1671680 RepID=A0AAE6RJT0_9MICO|nr:hypothetical protein [Rathayibacter tanaceti]QHC55033.1 hypothetical protein GSU10_04855 [Rathayibacter tanaceti]
MSLLADATPVGCPRHHRVRRSPVARRAAPRALRPVETVGYRWLALALSLPSSGVWPVSVVWRVIAPGGPDPAAGTAGPDEIALPLRSS